MSDPDLCQEKSRDPVHLARPKAPKAYQTESTQALSDEEVKALLSVVKAKADAGDILGKRDYALLLFFFATGMRRSEVTCLRWGDVKINDTVTITAKVKGGDYAGREIADLRVKAPCLTISGLPGAWAGWMPRRRCGPRTTGPVCIVATN